MSSLTLLGDTSGSVILQAPAVAGSGTVTLPTTGGIVRTTTTPGSILQVIQTTNTAATGTTGTSFIATTLTATITPSSASNKILIFYSGPSYTTGATYVYSTLYRNASVNLGFGGASALSVTGNNPGTYDTTVSTMYLDSPATTSAITYTVYIKTSGGGASGIWGDVGNCGQVMILQEVAA
jgi:hypothetical protein